MDDVAAFHALYHAFLNGTMTDAELCNALRDLGYREDDTEWIVRCLRMARVAMNDRMREATRTRAS